MRTVYIILFTWMSLFLYSLCFGYSGGNGTQSSPFEISGSDDLYELANTPDDYSKYFILTTNIDLQGAVFTTAIIAEDTDPNLDGFQGTSFTGFLDGSDHAITHFTINGGNRNYLGLFGLIYSGEVKDLGLENCEIIYAYDSEYVGGLAGQNGTASISRCYMIGNVTGDSSAAYIGGLIGLNFEGTIERCYSTGNVGGLNNSVAGGLVGLNSMGIVTHCYSTSNVTGAFDIGGLCGDNGGDINYCYASGNVYGADESKLLGGLCGLSYGTLMRCFAVGNVSSGDDSFFIGGLCGSNSSLTGVIDCYAAGSVTTGIFSSEVGGLCGENFLGVISNSYSAGEVLAGDFSGLVGGLCGYQSEDESEINNSFWDVETSGMTTGYNLDPNFPGDVNEVIGFTTDLMKIQKTFTDYGWDFMNESTNGTEDIWTMCDDGIDYPKLTWQFTEGGYVCPKAGYGYDDLMGLVDCWLSVIRAPEDINNDNSVNLADFIILARFWLLTDCGDCGGADITGDSNVDHADLLKIAEHWLAIENPDCQISDFSGDEEVDFEDFVILAQHWLENDSDMIVERIKHPHFN